MHRRQERTLAVGIIVKKVRRGEGGGARQGGPVVISPGCISALVALWWLGIPRGRYPGGGYARVAVTRPRRPCASTLLMQGEPVSRAFEGACYGAPLSLVCCSASADRKE